MIEKLNPIAYQLDAPLDLNHVHNVFYVPQPRNYVPDPDHAIITEPIAITEDLAYEEHSVETLDHRIKQLHNKQIPPVKVLWANHTSSEATWKTKEDMRTKYPHLFEVTSHLIKALSFEDGTF